MYPILVGSFSELCVAAEMNRMMASGIQAHECIQSQVNNQMSRISSQG
jgi:hypothetical protein